MPKLIKIELPDMLREVERIVQKLHPNIKYISNIRFVDGAIVIEGCGKGGEPKELYRLPR